MRNGHSQRLGIKDRGRYGSPGAKIGEKDGEEQIQEGDKASPPSPALLIFWVKSTKIYYLLNMNGFLKEIKYGLSLTFCGMWGK